jgi:hypothetical protein
MVSILKALLAAWIGLQPWVQVATIAFFFATIAVIAIWGSAKFKIGKRTFGFGKGRTCKDCMILSFAKRDQFEVKRRRLENQILKDQMNFAEHKLDSILFNLVQDYRNHLKEKRGDVIDYEKEDREAALYEEIVKHSLETVKDEIRRSFKENGFHEKGGLEFQMYVKNKAQDLVARARSYMAHRYPRSGMAISFEERFDRLDIGKLEDLCFDVYVNAKEVRNNIEKEIKELEADFICNIYDTLGIPKEEGMVHA